MKAWSMGFATLIAGTWLAGGCASNEGLESEGLVQYQAGLPAQPWGAAEPIAPAAAAPAPSTEAPAGLPKPSEQPTAGPAEQPPSEPPEMMPQMPTAEPEPVIEPEPVAGAEAPTQPDPVVEPEPVMEPEPEPVPLATKVIVDVTTESQGGRYSPRNVGAIWIENSQGQWVKTLAVWAFIRGRHLTRYLQANPVNNTVDAVTSATLRTHQEHQVEWDLTDATGAEVPDGEYSVFIECTDTSRSGKYSSVSFTKGGEPTMGTFDGPFDGFISYE